MTQSDNLDVNKLLSEELETKIYNVNQKYAKTRNEIKAEILDIYNSAIAEGYTPMQARRICEERIDIFSDRTIRRWLPGEATRSYSPRPIGQMSNLKEDKQPATLPLPPQPEVKEVEIIPEPEPPKAIDEPIAIPQRDTEIIKGVVFDPAPIDRDRTQVFILDIEVDTKKVKEYKTVGRRSVR